LKAKRAEIQDIRSHGFSRASGQRTAKRFSEMRRRLPDNYVVVDLETTGFNPDADEIIEIGAIKMIGHEKTDVFNALVLSNNPIPASVSTFTGIDEHMIRETGESLNEVLASFSVFLGALPMVGHNIDFDKRFLLSAYAKCELSPLSNRCVDTLGLARRLVKGVENYKLETLATRFGIESSNNHRSVSDCDVTAQLYRKLIKMVDTGSEDVVI